MLAVWPNPIIPLETRRKAIELVLGGMQQKQAAKQLGVSVGAVHNWVRAYRRGGMAALQPRCICLMVCVPVYRGFVGRVIGEKLTM